MPDTDRSTIASTLERIADTLDALLALHSAGPALKATGPNLTSHPIIGGTAVAGWPMTDILSAAGGAYRVSPVTPETASDGWIPWHGGDNPVPPETLVDVRLRNESGYRETRNYESRQWFWRWGPAPALGDIVAYRVSPVVPAPGVWIPHDGSGLPVPADTLVSVRFRDDDVVSLNEAGVPAGYWAQVRNWWAWGSNPTPQPEDIIAYRMVPAP